MSLRAFHLFFISLSTLLAFGCAWLLLENYRAQHDGKELLFAILAAVIGVGMIVYGVWFFKKSKKLIL